MSKNKGKFDWSKFLNNTASITAIIISMASFWFSWLVYNDSKKESLKISAQTNSSNYQTYMVRMTNSPWPKLFTNHIIIPVYLDLILTNDGEKNLSITDINIVETYYEGKNIKYTTNFNSSHSSLYNSIDDVEKNENALPINISSGDSKKVHLRLFIKCDSIASSILDPKNELDYIGKKVKIEDLKDKLDSHKIDFYDNKDTKKRQQRFKITFKTAKGKYEKEVYYDYGISQKPMISY